ncbi:MAG TPA: T9SS type A sorting domain-containing protein [Candidatus Kapabacteria bacterium]|nr:T9SS type A sorting domain-containing protein [Candidatus Kapabacteria bacterium]
MKKIIFILLVIFGTSNRSFGQCDYVIQATTYSYGDSVIVGDTRLIANHYFIQVPYYYGTPGDSLYIPDICTSYNLSVSNPAFLVPGVSPFMGYEVYFSPQKVGPDSALTTIQWQCGSAGDPCSIVEEYGYGLSDSFPKVRPQGWDINMVPDSLGKVWTNHSIPTFDNPISDTTTFSDFKAAPTNGASCSLQVFDSTTPITQYLAHPFVRKHPLNLVFSSSNYQSFGEVIFSTRMQHGIVDSLISYTLLVNWQAPSSVSNSNRNEISYSLPNPFTNHISIGFTLAKAEDVKAALFDVPGREIRSEEKEFDAGTREITFDTRNLPAGSYFYVLHGSEWNRSGKLVKMP